VREIRDDIDRRVRDLIGTVPTRSERTVRATTGGSRSYSPSVVTDFGETRSGDEIRAWAEKIREEYDDAPVRSFVLTLADRRIRECLRPEECAVLISA
jgi:hypothetical protein